MPLSLGQTYTAIAAGLTASFGAVGGVEPYAYSVNAGGAGGTINSATGLYTAPTLASSDPRQAYDTITVTDDDAATATATILVGTPLLLVCEIIQREMGLSPGRVWIWDQKIRQPQDSDIWIAISMPRCKPFSNINRPASIEDAGLNSQQAVNMHALLDIDICSRGPGARDRKEEVILALGSTYCEQQMQKNSFYVAKLPAHGSFVDISELDGTAIPYRYRISVAMQYMVNKVQPDQYFDTFEELTVVTDE